MAFGYHFNTSKLIYATTWPEITSLPVFLIFSRTVSYDAVPRTVTICFSRLVSSDVTPSVSQAQKTRTLKF